MAIVDHLRRTTVENGRHTMRLPLFHAGPLGFVPDTQVSIDMMRSEGPGEADCELVVCPFSTQLGHMFRLELHLRDEPYILEKLGAAIATLNLNIVDEASTVFKARKHLHSTFLLDWSTVDGCHKKIDASPAIVDHYRYLAERVPISDVRYVRLYETIIEHAGDLIEVDNRYGTSLPAISVTPYSFRSRGNHTETVRVERSGDISKFSSVIGLPEDLAKSVCSYTHHSVDEPIPYILASDGERRTLRVTIPRKSRSNRILRFGMKHNDQHPGAVATFGHGLGVAGFNTINTLLRKYDSNRSIWEVTCEDVDGGSVSLPPSSPAELVSWFHDRLVKACSPEVLNDFARYQASVTEADYPPPKSGREIRIGESDPGCDVETATAESPGCWRPAFSAEPSAISRVLDTAGRSGLDEYARQRFCRDVASRRGKQRPVMFLSYPVSGRAVADLVRESSLIELFEITEYQEADYRSKQEGAIAGIRGADVMVGLWHPDDRNSGTDQAILSPWMEFEYGIARALGRHIAIAQHEDVPRSAGIARLDNEVTQPRYKVFSQDALPALIEHLTTFAQVWQTNYLRLAPLG